MSPHNGGDIALEPAQTRGNRRTSEIGPPLYPQVERSTVLNNVVYQIDKSKLHRTG